MNLPSVTTDELRRRCEELRRAVSQRPSGPDMEQQMSDLHELSAEIRRRAKAARNEQQPPTQGLNQ